MDIFIDDLIRKLVEIRNDGYYYCEVSIVKPDDNEPGFMSFQALECGGLGGVDFFDDEETDVVEVPADEIEKYADQNVSPAPDRKVIKEIKITY